MKIGHFITAGLFLAATATWAEVNIEGDYSLHEVRKLDNTIDLEALGSNKVGKQIIGVDALGALMCGRDLADGEVVMAAIPCPVVAIPLEGRMQLAVFDGDGEGAEVLECDTVDVNISQSVMSEKELSAVAEIAIGGQGEQSVLVWVAHVLVKANNPGVLECAKSVDSKSGTGTIFDSPISKIKLKIKKAGTVISAGGTVVVPD